MSDRSTEAREGPKPMWAVALGRMRDYYGNEREGDVKLTSGEAIAFVRHYLDTATESDALAARLRGVLKERDCGGVNCGECFECVKTDRAVLIHHRDNLKADLLRAEEALQAIEKARPTKGVPIKDTLEGCNHIARTYFAARGGGK